MSAAFWENPVTVRVPATSANLGPGFDSLGLALTLFDEVTASATSGGVSVTVEGEGAGDVPLDDSHLIVTAMRAAFDAMGVALPGIVLSCVNRIPHARGLGSSSAAIVAGVMIARALVVDGDLRMSDDDLLGLVVALEGHPDNVAPCLLGGLTISWTDDASGAARAVSRHVVDGVRPVVLIPPEGVKTELARSMLPASVPHHDAAMNAGRAALLVDALTHDPSNLLAATRDLIHQDQRRQAMPSSYALMGELRAAGIAAAISGAGPSVIAFLVSDEQRTRLDAIAREHERFTCLDLTVDAVGAAVISG